MTRSNRLPRAELFPVIGSEVNIMIAYCTHCWREVNSETKECPGCHADLTLDQRPYDQKLIGALMHPLPEARVRICWLIGENRICRAVPNLMKLATEDPDLFVRKSALESLGVLGDPQSAPVLREISRGDNRFLASVASRSLRTIREENPDCVPGGSESRRRRN